MASKLVGVFAFAILLFVAVDGYTVTHSQFACMFPRVNSAKIDAWMPELNSGTHLLFNITSNLEHPIIRQLIARRRLHAKKFN